MAPQTQRTWTTPNGDHVTAWRYDQTSIEVCTQEGQWLLWSTGSHVDDDAAWLRLAGVPQLPDRQD